MNMLSNHLYNLMEQLTEDHQSLWRIRKIYIEDAKDCKQCIIFWTTVQAEKERRISELLPLIKEHFKEVK